MSTINKSSKDKDSTVLQKMDMLTPSVAKDKTTVRTMTGGIMTVFTVSLFVVLMSIKVVD